MFYVFLSRSWLCYFTVCINASEHTVNHVLFYTYLLFHRCAWLFTLLAWTSLISCLLKANTKRNRRCRFVLVANVAVVNLLITIALSLIKIKKRHTAANVSMPSVHVRIVYMCVRFDVTVNNYLQALNGRARWYKLAKMWADSVLATVCLVWRWAENTAHLLKKSSCLAMWAHARSLFEYFEMFALSEWQLNSSVVDVMLMTSSVLCTYV